MRSSVSDDHDHWPDHDYTGEMMMIIGMIMAACDHLRAMIILGCKIMIPLAVHMFKAMTVIMGMITQERL